MKKLVIAVSSIILLVTLASAKDLSPLSDKIEREIAKQTLPFANERVKQMCKEWPTCEEWVNNKLQRNPSFQVKDSEVERWVDKAENGKTCLAISPLRANQ